MENLPAVILAAGKGQRLGNVTDNIPKPMVEVNGIRIIDNLISSLIKNNIQQVVVVTGYLHEMLSEHLKQFTHQIDLVIIENEVYATTNNIFSLWKAEKYLANGFYLFEADIFFDHEIVKELVNSTYDNVILLGKHTSKMDGTVVDLNENSSVSEMFLKRHQKNDFDYSNKYKTMNFYKLSKQFIREFFYEKLRSHIEKKDLNSYYELIIEEALREKCNFYGLDATDLKWWEIDTQEDLNYCESLFKDL